MALYMSLYPANNFDGAHAAFPPLKNKKKKIPSVKLTFIYAINLGYVFHLPSCFGRHAYVSVHKPCQIYQQKKYFIYSFITL